MKYYLIAGEASGDLHGANLMKALRQQDAEADFRYWGGDLMQQVGGTLVKHYRDLAFMGFTEVISNLRTIFRNMAYCREDIAQYRPDVIIYIDYPGFNLRIAKWAKRQGFANHYYISPQIWAWKENRIQSIKRDIDKMCVILPFEKDFYEKKHNFPVHFVGHPLLDAIDERPPSDLEKFRFQHNLNEKKIIAILPGSRKQEIQKMLDTMLAITSYFANFQFVIAGAPGQEAAVYDPYLNDKNVHLVVNKTYELLSHATAALVTSGTATLETALFKVPQVVCYRGGEISYQIAKRVINLKYISLVNLIMDKKVVVELIQKDFNQDRLKLELMKILHPNYTKQILKDYDKLEKKLGGPGASQNTAALIYDTLHQNV
ncbi:MAG: lipid-A-disaccharide synthase [Leeuwenhoekiella sp.]